MIVYHHKERLKVARIVRSIAIKLVARAREQCQDETLAEESCREDGEEKKFGKFESSLLWYSLPNSNL